MRCDGKRGDLHRAGRRRLKRSISLSDIDDELKEIKKLINSDKSLVPVKRGQSGISAPVRPGAGIPAVQKKPVSKELNVSPPAQKHMTRPQERQTPPGTVKAPGQYHSYDISPDGKVSRRPDTVQKTEKNASDFNVNFDFDNEYKDVPENRPLRFRREKRTGCIGGILYSAFVICISLILASLLWMAAVDVLGFGADNELVNITVRNDFDTNDITDMLYDAGLIKYKFLFSLYAGYSNAEKKITAGSYVLNKNFDYRALVQGMTARAGVRVETTVTIPEGYTLAQIFNLLEDYGVVSSADDLWEAAANYNFKFDFLDEETLGDRLRLEGFLFPETYNFYIDSKPEQAINKFLREFNRRFTDTYIERAEHLGLSVRDIVNIAAMIEREAGSDDERSRISAVIHNRLNSKDFPFLQIDATIHYAIAGTNQPFSVDLDHPYNTYTNKGLPPGPIANPGAESIRAALYPDQTKEYFYALNKEGTHNFFRTNAQLQAFVNSPQYGGR